MINQLLPERIDNTYRGSRLALWLFALIVLTKTLMSVNAIFIGRYVARRADGIPLETFTPAATQTIVSMFAIWGLAQLVICLLCLLSLVRYRGLISFMLVLLLLEHLSRRLIFYVMPIERSGTPWGLIFNLGLLIVMMAGLALSLRKQANDRSQE